MSTPSTDASWIPLDALQSRFATNIAALATRYPEVAGKLAALVPSEKQFLRVIGDQITIGTNKGPLTKDGSDHFPADLIHPQPVTLTPASAIATINKMFPDGNYKVALIAGEDLGWLWNRLYSLPCTAATLPGYRPPMFFLMKDLQRLRIILHIQDWRELLADSRVRLFTGDDCAEQFCLSLKSDPRCAWPALWVTITSDIWPDGFNIESVFAKARGEMDAELTALNAREQSRADQLTAQEMAARFAGDRPLRVLGITSRYTTFLQHSMRDWIDAFERLGHATHLEIEGADHELSNSLVIARACAEFEPDLIIAIDHWRRSLFGVAGHIPVVMWIQDALPALFSAEAGAAQGPIDFTMTIDPLKMVHEFGYPAARTMSALIGVNDQRFTAPAPRSPVKYECDVCFVSHASMPAEALLAKYLAQYNSQFATRFLNHYFEQLKAIYDDGRMITNPILLRRMLDESVRQANVTIRPDLLELIAFLFSNQINNAFFRHQSLQWLADAGVNLHLYGKGWEQHPRLARFARGPADNQNALASIYRSSKINLHISPHGAVHQRVMEGLASGGFFMLRYCAGDMTERHFKVLHDYCKSNGITTDQQLRERISDANRIDPEIQTAMANVMQILQESPFEGRWSFMETLQSAEENGYVRSAASIWGADYDAVTWNSQAELIARVNHFLSDDAERNQRSESMRKIVLDRFTYVQMTRQVVDFVRSNVRRNAASVA